MGVSRRGYARHRGCAESAVRKALATGRITLEPDGTIDPKRADARWAATTDPAQQRLVGPQVVGRPERQNGSAAPPPGTGTAFLQARTANEVLKSHERQIRLARMKGELVDRAKAEALVFHLARHARDSWATWPARAAAVMAAELGVDPGAMQQVLESYVRVHLEELPEIRLDLT